MRCAVYIVFVFSMVCFTQAQLGLVRDKGHRGRIGPPGIPGIPPPWTLKYCPVSSTITTFLNKFRSLKTSGLRVNDGFRARQRFRIRWPYNCLHAGLNYHESAFEMDTYQCCKSCEYPSYSLCNGRYSSSAGQDRCNSEALRCVAKCINTKGNRGRPGPIGRPGPVGRPGPPGPKGSCPTKTKRVGGSWCKERSCIRI